MKNGINDISRGNIKNFKWSSVLSGFTNAKTKEERDTTLMSGLPGHVPYEKDMMREWEPPYLFFYFGIYAILILTLIVLAQYLFGFGNALLIGVVPFVIPMIMLLFFWELNIPRNISLIDTIGIMLLTGIMSFYIVYSLMMFSGTEYSDYIIPLIFCITKLLLICFCLRKRSRGYGLNGILIGAAVGAGYSSIITGEKIFQFIQQYANTNEYIPAVILLCVFQIGGDVVWTATFGGALALSKGKNKLSLVHLANPLFIICFLGTYLIEVFWNLELASFFGYFLDNPVAMIIYNFLEVYQGRYIILILISWALFLFVARKCIVEANGVAEKARDEEKRLKANFRSSKYIDIFGVSGIWSGKKFESDKNTILFGRGSSNDVRYSEETKGISVKHCMICNTGDKYVLIDENSSYGTFLMDGTKLEAGREYPLSEGMEFYLASPENRFKVSFTDIHADNENAILNVGRRTNEPIEENAGQKVYIAVIAVFALIFLFLYFYSEHTSVQIPRDVSTVQQKEQSITGAWKCDTFDVQALLKGGFDNVIVKAEMSLFKDSFANGVTFDQEGNAYCTMDGNALDYAKFTYSMVDDETIHMEWEYSSMDFNLGYKGIIGVEKNIGDVAGYDAKYHIDNGVMTIDFWGENLIMTK